MRDLVSANLNGYVVLGPMGSGGSGTVYRAIHEKLGRTVAIKVLNSGTGALHDSAQFLQEARLQAALRHPGIATLYDFFDQDGQLCIVMELVEGPTLAELIQKRGVLPSSEALTILLEVGEAVRYLHSQNIIHQDIKASNIKICPDGTVKLLDFGVASRAGSTTFTGPGTITATFEYSAPERIAGLATDARSDIWSLGVLLYEMISGGLPFEATAIPELCRRIQYDELPREPLEAKNVRREVERLICRCLNKRPAQRFQTLDELQLAANDALAHDRRPMTGRTLPRLSPLHITAFGIVLAIALAVLLLSGSAHPQPAAIDTAKSIDIDVVDDPAEVYRDGQDLGQTPVHLKERMGQHVSLVLKRSGYADLPVDFDVDERSSYSYVLQPTQ